MRESRQGITHLLRHLVVPKATITPISLRLIGRLTHFILILRKAKLLGIKDKDLCGSLLQRRRQIRGALFNVLARVGQAYALHIHIDTDEANAFR
jgi:propanediol utilization protein